MPTHCTLPLSLKYGIVEAFFALHANVLSLGTAPDEEVSAEDPHSPGLEEMMSRPGGPGRPLYMVNTDVRHAWESMRRQLRLPAGGEAGPKLIRRSMATLARKRTGEANWPQGKMLLGHVKFGVSDIYAIPDPAKLGLALKATEAIIEEIDELCPGAFYCTSAEVDAA